MEEYKIGDIVSPRTKINRDKYGVGMVISINDYPKERINVFCVSNTGVFESRGFIPNSLEKIGAPDKFRTMITTAYSKYNNLVEELKRA